MNERIRELAEQTGWAEHIRYKPTRIEIEKFAELIVEECLLKINGAKIRNESYTELIGRIKEDFGVEE